MNKWEIYASTRDDKISASQVQADSIDNQQAEFNPSRRFVHKIFVSYNAFAGICAGLLGLGQILGEFLTVHNNTVEKNDIKI